MIQRLHSVVDLGQADPLGDQFVKLEAAGEVHLAVPGNIQAELVAHLLPCSLFSEKNASAGISTLSPGRGRPTTVMTPLVRAIAHACSMVSGRPTTSKT